MTKRNDNVKDVREGLKKDMDTTPSRYQIIEKEEGRYLQCSNSSNLHLVVDRQLAVDEAQRRNYPSQTIFLDGVYLGAPFLDNKNRQYSLDHHNDCVRAFTLATCEQAVVMLLAGLPLSEGTWSIYINDPDLDAVLSAWVLLNHREMLKEEMQLLSAAMPLIRIEGNIDAHGFDKTVLTGLSDEVLNVHKRTISRLMQMEREKKEQQVWEKMDALEYTSEMLDKLDHLFLTDSYLFQLLEVEEVSSLPIEKTQVAILCRSSKGIYDAELALKERYDRQLGVIVLEKAHGHYTLRQVDRFLHHDLHAAYKLLNRQDPKADTKNGNQWGGSGDIGGSPRSTGSGLAPEEILKIIQKAYQHVSIWRRFWRWMTR